MPRILVIDDDPSILTVFKRYLVGHGYDVITASNGGAGLSQIENELPDLVVTDVMMPEKDGLEVVLELRKLHPGLPVIAISGGMRMAPMDFLPMIKKFGARYVFYKPVELEELLGAIRESLGEEISSSSLE